jgi:hypothetical protein
MAAGSNETTTGGSGMVTERLIDIRDRIDQAADRAGRDPAEITLVVVSKGRSPAEIVEAYETGHRDFGENRASELAEKAPQLPKDIVWHFIGSLQTRQAKVARPHTALLHSLDRQRLVNTWAVGGAAPPVLLQVNVAAEQQKHGTSTDEAVELLVSAREAGLACRGLMTIPPLTQEPEDSRQWFAKLRDLRDNLRTEFPALVDLSMGMTDDFEIAIEEGATIIRVGRAIFEELGAPAMSD